MNPEKYIGNPSAIIFRSGWEKAFMHWCDITSQVVKWGSEEIIIPYRSPIDNEQHRYFVDFVVFIKNKENVQKYIVEIKPYAQTKPPKLPKKQSLIENYKKSLETYSINQAKWKYANEYCNKMGYKFIVLTEKELIK